MRPESPPASERDPGCDREQPRAQTVRIAQRLDLSPRGQEGVGDDLFSVLLIAEDQEGDCVNLAPMPFEKVIETVQLTLTDPGRQISFVQAIPPEERLHLNHERPPSHING